MNKGLLHILYATICIVLFIISLLFFWWFTAKPEGFITPMPYVIFVGVASDGAVYYADVDVPMSPKWVANGITGVGDIAGTYGQLYTILSGGSVPKYGPYDSGSQTAMAGGLVTQIAADDANLVGGVNGTSFMYSTTLTGTLSQKGTQKQISLSNMTAYALGTDGALYYSSTPNTGGWVKTSPVGTTFKQVSFDNQVCALDTAGNLWCADTNIGNASANWTRQGTRQFNNICLKDGRLIGVGTDGRVYYSDSYSSPSWDLIATQPYNSTGASTGSPVTFSKVIMMFPRLDARRRRFLGGGSCNSNEEKIGAYCYQDCPSGRKANGIFCPYKVKFIPALASCPAGTEFINDACFKPCPAGYTNSGDKCQGATTVKQTKPLATASSNPSYVTPDYNCPTNGTVAGQYVRVRPTSLIANNKLCIQRLVVKDAAGNILTGNAKASDGTCADAPIGGILCGTGFKTYLSGSKWDGDADGGTKNRSANLYWDLDLGSVKNIKTIEFTGCNYIQPGTSASAVTPITTSKADQITGMKIEVLFNSNQNSTTPLVSRSLGPSSGSPQVITFNYSIKDSIMPGRCFDSCPPINGVQSASAGDRTCIAASGGITNRSVTVPLELPEPVCAAPTDANGNLITVPAVDMAGRSVSIANWVPDPAKEGYIMSCDNLPGSTLMPISKDINLSSTTSTNKITVAGYQLSLGDSYQSSIKPPSVTGFDPDLTKTSVTQIWQDKDTGNAITNSETPYICVKLSNSNGFCPVRTSIAQTLIGINSGNIGKISFSKNNLCELNDSNFMTNFTITMNRGNKAYCAIRYMDWYRADYDTVGNCGCTYTNRTWNAAICNRWGNYESCSWSPGTCNSWGAQQCTDFGFLGKSCIWNAWHCNSWGARLCATLWGCIDNNNGTFGGNWHDWPDTIIPGENTCMSNRLKYTPGTFNLNLNVIAAYSVFGKYYAIVDNPILKKGVDYALPQRQKGTCKCLNADGSVNKSAFVYNGKCVKCSSDNDVFYARGDATALTWSAQTNTCVPRDTSIGPKQFRSIEDAKNLCEATSDCKGVIRINSGSGSGVVGGTLYALTAQCSGAGQTVKYDSWVKGSGTDSRATVGNYTGKAFSTTPIPRAFADDYIHSSPPQPPTGVTSTTGVMDIYQTGLTAVTDMVTFIKRSLGAASAQNTLAQSVERPYTYYSLVGMERRLKADVPSTTDNYGICVGPCDPLHPTSDPIQMLYNETSNPKTYVLYGTTCHDATLITINQPSIPAIYTPETGQQCPPVNGVPYSVENGRCVQECMNGDEDKGSSCSTASTPRTFSLPAYSCPSPLTKVDNVCVFTCDAGATLKGDYCEPASVTASISGSSNIKCTSTPYLSGKKWLCESENDLKALLAGTTLSGSAATTGGSTAAYTGPDDVVCSADDPTTGMYYCQSVSDIINEVPDTARDSFSATCDRLVKAYYDLSNNLNILSGAKVTAQNAAAQVANIQITLQGVYNSMCANSSGSSGSSGSSNTAMCRNMQTQLAALAQNINTGGSRTSAILNPIEIAVASRDNLVTQMNNFQCTY
jgi:hypothetical protein